MQSRLNFIYADVLDKYVFNQEDDHCSQGFGFSSRTFPNIYLYLQLLSVVMHSRIGKANAGRPLATSFQLEESWGRKPFRTRENRINKQSEMARGK